MNQCWISYQCASMSPFSNDNYLNIYMYVCVHISEMWCLPRTYQHHRRQFWMHKTNEWWAHIHVYIYIYDMHHLHRKYQMDGKKETRPAASLIKLMLQSLIAREIIYSVFMTFFTYFCMYALSFFSLIVCCWCWCWWCLSHKHTYSLPFSHSTPHSLIYIYKK